MATKTNKSRKSPSASLGNCTYLKRSDVLAAGTTQQRTAKPGRVKGKPPA